MKYTFHVGDYVETKDGDIGVVTKVNMGIACWYCTHGDGPRTKAQEYVIFVGTDEDMARIFNRIGQYDFAKKDREIASLNKFEDSMLWTTALEQCRLKINECVDAVNELRAAQKGG